MADAAHADEPQAPAPSFPVVGIGASAGGLEAFSELLRALPDGTGMALVFVQHLSPSHESMLPELLASATRTAVVQITDGMRIEPDHVYVAPAGSVVQITGDGAFHLVRPAGDHSPHMPIDSFLRSLAAYAQDRAVGVVLSGNASDGSAGLREIKAFGGITLAQEPRTAKYDGMPRAAAATGAVDKVLDPAQIAAELARIAHHPLVRPPRPGAEHASVAEDLLHRVFSILRNATGVDFTHYKQPTIKRRLQRRMVLHKVSGLDQYIRLMQHDPKEVQTLYADLLIHVTRFFREPESFETLRHVVFPAITAHRHADEPLRIWVPGCATGEEPYSVAMALLEYLGDQAGPTPVQVFATDLSDAAVEQARAGMYPESIAEDVSAERLRRFFTRTDGHYRISKQVRDLCVFARQDLTRDPPFSKLDLIVCRNVLIYLGAPLQKKLMNVFHYALKPTGFLMLGSAETVGAHTDLFAVADKRHRLYTRKLATLRPDMHFSPAGHAERVERSGKSISAKPASSVHDEASRLIIERYSPPGVIVNNDLQIIQFRGHTGPYLEPAPGEASLGLLKMAREGLLFGLRSAITEARRGGRAVRKDALRVKHNGHVRDVHLQVIPLDGGPGGKHFLILFEDATAKAAAEEKAPGRKRAGGKPAKRSQREPHGVERLQEELAASREYLQSIIQDLEAANEELQSANEEILSSNEELQSTNEELDTAKEELQSTNEELNTVNEELHGRNEELSRVNSDLVNLLASVQIAIVMVTADLRIRRFTPMAEKVLNLIPTDLGRPISDIKPNIDCPELEQLIRESIDSVNMIEREVRDRLGTIYALRIRPYKSLDNRIDGAVLALFDVDGERRREAEARAEREFANAVVETARGPLLVLDARLRVKKANPAFYRAFGVERGQTEGALIYELGNGQWNIPALRSLLEEVMPANGRFEDFLVKHDFPGLGQRTMRLNAARVPGPDGKPASILLAVEDVSQNPR